MLDWLQELGGVWMSAIALVLSALCAGGVIAWLFLRRRPGSGDDPKKRMEQLVREERFSEAGDVCMAQGNLDGAVPLYLRAGDYQKACACLVSLNQPTQAAELYLSYGRIAEAAHYFQAAGVWKRAADCLDHLGSKREAAELYERASDLGAAARCLREIGDNANAARLLERAGRPAEAAEAWRAVRSDPSAKARAAELFELAGEHRRAAECWAAAECWTRAAELFDQLEDFGLAAQAYERAGEFVTAAEAYERVGALPEARANFEKAGEHLRFAELSFQMGQFLDAGRGFYDVGSYERAIESLQSVPATSSRGSEASLLLGKIFLEKSLYARARQKFQSILVDPPTSPQDIEVFALLAETLEKSGDALAALGWVEKIEEHDPAWPEIEGWLDRLQERALGGSSQNAQAADKRYALRAQIGRGGMGVVHLAQDRELERAVAIKFLPYELAAHSECLQLFRQEARAAAAMNHPNIVQIYDVTVIDGRPCIVMEYVQGQTVRQLIKESGTAGMSAKRLAEVCRDTCDALAYAHMQKVIHRDVKPGNIIVSDRGPAKLMDFGVSKILESELEGQTRPRGTPQYMSPEQILGRDMDGRTDLYALGISMFEALTTVRPFRGDDVVQQQLRDPLPDPRSYRADIPAELTAIILKACAKDVNERYQSAREMADALGSFLQRF